MKLVTLAPDLRAALKNLPAPRILVPTMGALHDGHLTLVRHARQLAGKSGSVILTLFVNPTQFDKTEDLERYPRTLENDIDLCRTHGVDLLFAPDSASMYHPDHSVSVVESALTHQLCGATRPGHFDGVCTIVLKLFNLTQPDAAVFGKKDYQQLAVIRRMTRDLNVPVHIEGVDTVREASGLALSSRNTRLTEQQHADAPRIRRALLAARAAHAHGESSAHALLDIARQEISASVDGARIDYLELLDAESLQPIDPVTAPAVLATAVFYGTVRLIDNIELPVDSPQ
jgi:pantoate--beta-alanine ligase